MTFVSDHFTVSGDVASEDESVPIVVVIPGLTSDSSSQVTVSILTLFFIYPWTKEEYFYYVLN